METDKEPLDRHRRDGANQTTKHHKDWYRLRQRLHRVQALCVEAMAKLKLKLKLKPKTPLQDPRRAATGIILS